MAQAIFKSWFVDFKPFQDGEFEDSELGRIPKEWKVSKLRALCKVITKGTTPTTLKRKFVDAGINFVKAESINNHHSFDIQCPFGKPA
jgi:type I restriction enzyme S subunit